MRINDSTSGLGGINRLDQTQRLQERLHERLASGRRLNRASDDAAALVTSERLRAAIGGLDQASRNLQDGIGQLRTADGGLDRATQILQRMRELAVSAANPGDASAQQAEVDQLTQELDAIGDRTTFAGEQVFTDMSAPGAERTYQTGPGSNDQLTVDMDLSLGADSVAGVDVSGLDLQNDPTGAIERIDDALGALSGQRAELGATDNRFERSISDLQGTRENLIASESRIGDTDMALAMVQKTAAQIREQSTVAMLAQSNVSSGMVAQLL